MNDDMGFDDYSPPFNPTPPPNEEFCIFRAPGSTPQYLERYGIVLHDPDTSFKPKDCAFYVWSVFDLEDLGFKVFLDGNYNYKIKTGIGQDIMRFRTDEHAPEVSTFPRTKENLWFMSYRINQITFGTRFLTAATTWIFEHSAAVRPHPGRFARYQSREVEKEGGQGGKGTGEQNTSAVSIATTVLLNRVWHYDVL